MPAIQKLCKGNRMALNNVYINRISTFLPNDPVSNDEMENMLGMVAQRPSKVRRVILKSNGIKYRYYAIDKHTGKRTHSNAQLAAEAIRKLTDEDFTLDDIEHLICSTSSPDQFLPSHAVMVHGELQNSSCEVASIAGICVCGIQALKYGYMCVLSGMTTNAVCSASELASSFMRGNQFEGEIKSRTSELTQRPILAFKKDFLRWMLSDGAGAVLLQNNPNSRGLSLKIDWIDIYSFANELPTCMYQGAEKDEDDNITGYRDYVPEQWVANSTMAVKQDVKLLNKHIVPVAIKAFLMTLEKRRIDVGEIDYFLPHLSSEYFREELHEAYRQCGNEIPQSKWFTNLNSVGNVGSVSIYLMLGELLYSGKLEKGNKLLLMVPESGRFTMSYTLLTVV